MTTTYNSTSSFGKLKFETEHLIPTLKQMLVGASLRHSIGLLGAPNGVERHVLNMDSIGIPREHQVYVEIDKPQYKKTKPIADSYGVDYRFGDIIEHSTALPACLSIQDLDACGVFGGTNLGWIDWLYVHRYSVDIQIQVVNLHNGNCSIIDTFCKKYDIDSNLPHTLKVGLLFQKYCKLKGFNCAWRSYIGAGSKEGKTGGNPMMCVIISRIPIPVQFHMITDYKLVYDMSKVCIKPSGKVNALELERRCGGVVRRLTAPVYIRNYELLTSPQNQV
jgi:hypothetical protein